MACSTPSRKTLAARANDTTDSAIESLHREDVTLTTPLPARRASDEHPSAGESILGSVEFDSGDEEEADQL